MTFFPIRTSSPTLSVDERLPLTPPETPPPINESQQGDHDDKDFQELILRVHSLGREVISPAREETPLLPEGMSSHLRLEDIQIQIIEEHEGFSALMFLLLLASHTFDKILLQPTQHKGKEYIKILLRFVKQQFLATGCLKTHKLDRLLAQCYDGESRIQTPPPSPGLSMVQEIQQQKYISLETMNRLLGKTPTLPEAPRVEEYFRYLLPYLDERNEMTPVVLKEGFQGTLEQYCHNYAPRVTSSSVVFVRSPLWQWSEEENVFPSPRITLGDKSYLLKGVIVFNPYAPISAYTTYIVQKAGALFCYDTSHEDFQEPACIRIEEVLADFALMEPHYASLGTHVTEGAENLRILLNDMRRYAEAFLYERV